jgi:hypothetical protein
MVWQLNCINITFPYHANPAAFAESLPEGPNVVENSYLIPLKLYPEEYLPYTTYYGRC